jgi:hypothetical protein
MRGIACRLDQRASRTGSNRDVAGTRNIKDAQGVVDDAFKRRVARDAADAEHVDVGVSYSEKDSESIVYAGVDVEDDGQ